MNPSKGRSRHRHIDILLLCLTGLKHLLKPRKELARKAREGHVSPPLQDMDLPPPETVFQAAPTSSFCDGPKSYPTILLMAAPVSLGLPPPSPDTASPMWYNLSGVWSHAITTKAPHLGLPHESATLTKHNGSRGQTDTDVWTNWAYGPICPTYKAINGFMKHRPSFGDMTSPGWSQHKKIWSPISPNSAPAPLAPSLVGGGIAIMVAE